MYLTKNQSFVTLLSVLISMAIGISIAVSGMLLGVGFSRNALVIEQSNQAKALANACSEKALESLRENLNYAGSETVNLGQGYCHIFAVLGSGNTNRIVEASGTVNSITRKVQVDIAVVSPQIQLTDWQEVADF